MCEKKIEIEIKKRIEKRIENKNLKKINLYSKKRKKSIKKRHNDFIFLYVFL